MNKEVKAPSPVQGTGDKTPSANGKLSAFHQRLGAGLDDDSIVEDAVAGIARKTSGRFVIIDEAKPRKSKKTGDNRLFSGGAVVEFLPDGSSTTGVYVVSVNSLAAYGLGSKPARVSAAKARTLFEGVLFPEEHTYEKSGKKLSFTTTSAENVKEVVE